jgi:Cytochrome P460
MKTSYLVGVNIATFLLLVVAAYGLGETRKPGKEPDAQAVVDAYGTMHVPERYRITYRFPGSWNRLWGNGWGWSWFDASNPSKTTSSDYRADCQGCHVPAQSSEWIYIGGYAPLRP